MEAPAGAAPGPSLVIGQDTFETRFARLPTGVEIGYAPFGVTNRPPTIVRLQKATITEALDAGRFRVISVACVYWTGVDWPGLLNFGELAERKGRRPAFVADAERRCSVDDLLDLTESEKAALDYFRGANPSAALAREINLALGKVRAGIAFGDNDVFW